MIVKSYRAFEAFSIMIRGQFHEISMILRKGDWCPEMPPYLVPRILKIFLQFCLHFSENFSSGLLIYSQG